MQQDSSASKLAHATPGQSIEPMPGDAAVAVTAAPTPRLSLRRSLLYSSGNLGSGIFFALNNFVLPLFLDALHVPVFAIGLLSSTRSLEGAVLQPIVGAWSDRTWTRWGRRRPFILRFVPFSMFFILLTPFLPGLSTSAPLVATQRLLGLSQTRFIIVLVALSVFLFTLTFNVMSDPYNALLADITPQTQRGHVNGLFQAVGAIGQASFLLLVAFLGGGLGWPRIFLIAGLALGLFFIPTVLGVREPRELPGLSRQHRYSVRDYWNGLKADRQLQLYFAVQFFLWFGLNAITPYLTLYATKEAHFSDQQALILTFVLLVTTAIFNWPFGALADRLGLKRIFLFGMMLLSGACVAGIFTIAMVPLFIILTVAGIGNAAQTASSYPLLTRLVFPDQMGLYTGLNSTVNSIAAPVSVAIAGGLIGTLGYHVMFPFVAIMFLCSLVPLTFLRMDQSVAARALARAQIPANMGEAQSV